MHWRPKEKGVQWSFRTCPSSVHSQALSALRAHRSWQIFQTDPNQLWGHSVFLVTPLLPQFATQRCASLVVVFPNGCLSRSLWISQLSLFFLFHLHWADSLISLRHDPIITPSLQKLPVYAPLRRLRKDSSYQQTRFHSNSQPAPALPTPLPSKRTSCLLLLHPFSIFLFAPSTRSPLLFQFGFWVVFFF